ncbi:putative RNA-directed DNA polymerase [Tanacetum coccineum]
MDVKTAFLHGDLDKEIYMEQPEGFQVKRKEDYESKASRQDFFMLIVVLLRCGDDDFSSYCICCIDMLIVARTLEELPQLSKICANPLLLKDLGPAKQILAFGFSADRGAKKLHYIHRAYTLRRCAQVGFRSSVVVVSRFLSNHGMKHWELTQIWMETKDKHEVNFWIFDDLCHGELFHGNHRLKSAGFVDKQRLSKRKVEIVAIRRMAILILIDRKWGRFVGADCKLFGDYSSSLSLFVAIYLDIDSKFMMIVVCSSVI